MAYLTATGPARTHGPDSFVVRDMELICYRTSLSHEVQIRPAPKRRTWMDQTPEWFAYRCLPLSIANAHGWEILCPASFEVVWDGRPSKEGVTVVALEG